MNLTCLQFAEKLPTPSGLERITRVRYSCVFRVFFADKVQKLHPKGGSQ